MANRKRYYDIEKIMKGVANHRRAEMLFLLHKESPLSTNNIVETLNINYQTGATHAQRLVSSGLVSAYRKDAEVLHELSPLGKSIMKLLINI